MIHRFFRNRKLRAVALVMAFALVLTACSSATESGSPDSPTGQLRLLAWAGYDDPSWISEFEQQYDAEVVTTYVGSVDEMFAKVRTQGENFDIVFPDSSSIARYVETGLLRPLDRSRLPNLKNMLPFWQNQNYYEVGGDMYAVPFTGGATPIIYNATLIPDPEASWGLLWNKEYAGKLGMLDDSNNSVVITALYLGLDDPFNLSDADFELVKQSLVEQSALIRKYITGEDEEANLLASGEILAAPEIEPGIADELNAEGGEYVFAELFPKEGALAWVDNMVIPDGSPNPDLAYAFLNFALTSTVQAGLVSKYSFLPVIDVQAFVSDETKARVANLAEFIDQLQLLQSPEDPERRVQIWTEVRAGS